MELTYFIVILVVVIGGFVGLYFLSLKKEDQPESESTIMLQQQIQELNRTVQQQTQELNKTIDNKLGDSTKAIQQQFGQSTKIITDVTERLTKLDETNKQVLDFSSQLKNLQDILKNPKQRGVWGEYYLENLLKNAFSPNQYQMQYEFKDGMAVDAVLFLGDKIIPIDSKFSLENYNRIAEENDPNVRESLEKDFKNDLKKRIDETAKYIRPNEGTMEFALMFIPAEGIYYDLLVNKIGTMKSNTRDLINYAVNDKKVHIVSPNTLHAMLQTILAGMRTYQIQEQTKDILKNVGNLERHLKAYWEHYIKVGNHMRTTVNAYNASTKEFKKIDKDVIKLEGEGMRIDVELLDKPQQDDE